MLHCAVPKITYLWKKEEWPTVLRTFHGFWWPHYYKWCYIVQSQKLHTSERKRNDRQFWGLSVVFGGRNITWKNRTCWGREVVGWISWIYWLLSRQAEPYYSIAPLHQIFGCANRNTFCILHNSRLRVVRLTFSHWRMSHSVGATLQMQGMFGLHEYNNKYT